eukprot:scaffold235741_cov24-Tisochrysis_lutea.AAC.1
MSVVGLHKGICILCQGLSVDCKGTSRFAWAPAINAKTPKHRAFLHRSRPSLCSANLLSSWPNFRHTCAQPT